jgi:cytidylate kinase
MNEGRQEKPAGPMPIKEDASMAVITISRQYGTGGIHIGRKIAEKLGYRFMYLDELVAACRERRLEIDLERIEGRPPKIVERLFGLNRDKVRDTIREVMKEAAQGGDIVIGGWGGQVLLKDHPGAFHLRIVGSDESRTRHIMNSAGLPYAQANEIVERTNRDQSLFSHFFFNVDFSDPKLYHTVLNIDQTSGEEIVEIAEIMLEEIKQKTAADG